MSRLEFVPARLPDPVTVRPSDYVVIEPRKPVEDDINESDASTTESDATPTGQPPKLGSSASDSVSETDTSSGSSDDSESEAMSDSEDSGTPNTPETPSTPPKNSHEKLHSDSKQEFWDVNENPKDRGTRTPARIWKSWSSSASSPVGLENRGVTCYLNAAVQLLFHLPAFGRYMQQVNRGSVSELSKGSVSHDVAQLFKRAVEERRKSRVYPAKLLRRLDDINPMLSEYEQEDSHEFLMSLIGKLQDESVPKGQKLRSSVLFDMFGGSLEQKVRCRNCGHISTTNQDFYDLPVYFNGHRPYTLEKSISHFFSPEAIKSGTGGQEGYDCDNCKKTAQATKTCLVAEAPEYLTVHLMRFKFEQSSSHKVKDPMSYPMELDLTPYSTSHEPLRYKLVAVVVHEGRTVSSGHYIALCRQPSNEWAMYDDEVIRKVPENFVRDQQSAYILLYSKLTPKSGTRRAPKLRSAITAPAAASNQSRRKTSVVRSSSIHEDTAISPSSPVRPPLALPRSKSSSKSPEKGGWSSSARPQKRTNDEIDAIFSKRRKS